MLAQDAPMRKAVVATIDHEVPVPYDDAFRSPEALLRHAAAADAAHAAAMLRRVSATRLLDLVVTQAELAVDEDRSRPAGIDAVGDLARAAIEVMDLPQGTEFDLDEDDDPDMPPTVTGWELITVAPEELAAATLALPVSPWLLALVAFRDEPDGHGSRLRHVVGAAADGRVAAARLRMVEPHRDDVDADVLAATVTRDADDLGPDAPLAEALVAALRSAARGA
jgi:hypothetical protein